MAADTTAPSYWLNWRFLLCAIWILVAILFAAVTIWRYEGRRKSITQPNGNHRKAAGCLYKGEAWGTCSTSVHPIWLLAYRVVAFCTLLAFILTDTIIHSVGIFYFYTEWTFTLVTIYFGLGSWISIHGCLQGRNSEKDHCADQVTEENNMNISSSHNNDTNCGTASFWEYAVQIIFQICAGAVVLTDSVFWLIIYPFLTPKTFRLHVMVIAMHSINAVFILGEAILNHLRFPFFRIAYFVLWTCIFVVFQWIIHTSVSMAWPYAFLDLSSSFAPIWYLGVGLLHFPCFGIFTLVFKLKRCCLSR